MLLVHGSLCDLRYWRWQLSKLAPSMQVVSLSLPGYWPSEPLYMAYDFNIDNHCAAIADVIQAVRQPQQKVHLLGHSRGAHVVSHYLQQHPHTVDSVILADPAFILNLPPMPLSVLDQAATLIAAGDEMEGLNVFIDAVSGPSTWSQMVGWFKTMVQDNAHTLIAQSRETMPIVGQAHIDALKQLPALLISGEHSPTRYKQSLQALQSAVPDAQVAVIPKASHGMNLANPKAFNQAVIAFTQMTRA